MEAEASTARRYLSRAYESSSPSSERRRLEGVGGRIGCAPNPLTLPKPHWHSGRGMPRPSPSNSGKTVLLCRVGSVKKMWGTAEETGLYIVFFSFLFWFSLFLPISYVPLTLGDPDQHYYRCPPTPSTSMIHHPISLLHLCATSKYKTYSSGFFFSRADQVRMTDSLSEMVKENFRCTFFEETLPVVEQVGGGRRAAS